MSSLPLRMVLEIEDQRWSQALPDVSKLIQGALEAALADVESQGRDIEVGVRLVDDGAIQALNRDWRGKDQPTNVLSFPLGDPGPIAAADFPWLLGDIVMSYDTVTLESARDRKPLEHHVVHLAVHAALHLIGLDHVGDAEADAMEAAEIGVLAGLGIPDPYLPAAGGDQS